jgi:hypothetical protein
MTDRHPTDHNQERAALNDLQAQVDSGTFDITQAEADIVALEALQVTESTAFVAGLSTALALRAVRIPIQGSNPSIHVTGTIQSNKGSAYVAGDDLFTIPANFRPPGAVSGVWALNLSTGGIITVTGPSTGGLCEFAAGSSTAAAQFYSFDFHFRGVS